METNKQNLTYGSLWAFKDRQNLSLEGCLSELIDNSISSFQNNLEFLGTKTLKIELIVKRYTNGDVKMIIIDNAYGMDEQELKDSIQLYKNVSKKNKTSMNQYGIGLKSAIFWIGNNAQIYTKNQDKTHKLIFLPKKEEREDNTDFESSVHLIPNGDDDIKVSGTKIIIDCYEKQHRKYWAAEDKDKTANLLDYLGKKYSKYLKNNDEFELELFIKYVDEKNHNNNYEKQITSIEFNENPLKLSDLNIDFYNDDKLNEIKQKYNDKVTNKNEVIEKLEKLLFANKPLIWSDKIYLDDNKKFAMNVNFSFLNKGAEAKSGLAISHNKRYIYFPIKKTNNLGCYQYYNNDRFLQGHYKWLLMELALENIDGNEKCDKIKPDENKTSLVFSDDDSSAYTKNKFDKAFYNYVKSIEDVLAFIADVNQKYKVPSINSKKDYFDSIKNEKSVVSQTNVDFDEEKNILVINENYKIEINYTENFDEEKIIKITNINDANKTVNVEINKESKLIKKNDRMSMLLLLLYIELTNKDSRADGTKRLFFSKNSSVENILKKISEWSNNE